MSSARQSHPRYRKCPHGDPVVLIAQSTAGEIGVEFLAALVRSMHQAMDVTIAVITRGIGEPPERARAAFSWKQPGTTFPDEYDLEGTPCRLVYEGQTLMVPEQLWQQFPRRARQGELLRRAAAEWPRQSNRTFLRVLGVADSRR